MPQRALLDKPAGTLLVRSAPKQRLVDRHRRHRSTPDGGSRPPPPGLPHPTTPSRLTHQGLRRITATPYPRPSPKRSSPSPPAAWRWTLTATLDLQALGFRAGDLGSLVRVVEAQDLLERAGTCTHPIRLIGSREVIEAATGQLLDSTSARQISVNCGNRRASRCGYCSTLYKYDAYNLVAAGLRGGKDVPVDVQRHPRLFVTVTAPSFGPVHLGPDKASTLRPCRPRRDGSGCRAWHRADDPLIGTPLDPSTYDYQGHVLFNALAGKLWSKTLDRNPPRTRHPPGPLPYPRSQAARGQVRQSRRVPDARHRALPRRRPPRRTGRTRPPPPPPWATAELLDAAVRDGVARARIHSPHSHSSRRRHVRLGSADRRTPDHLGGLRRRCGPHRREGRPVHRQVRHQIRRIRRRRTTPHGLPRLRRHRAALC